METNQAQDVSAQTQNPHMGVAGCVMLWSTPDCLQHESQILLGATRQISEGSPNLYFVIFTQTTNKVLSRPLGDGIQVLI